MMDSYKSNFIFFRRGNLAQTPIAKATRTRLQLFILNANTMLEWLRLASIKTINHHTNGIQQQLFFLSMWIDRRFDK